MPRRQDDRYHIEADLLPIHTRAPGVVAGYADQVKLFFRVDRPVRVAEFSGIAGLHLYEDQVAAMPDYQVDFPVSGRRAIIARYNCTTTAPQKAVRKVLSKASVIGGERPAPKGVRSTVDQVEQLFHDLKFEFHDLSAHHVAEVMLPKFSVAAEMIHQEFEPQPPPQRQ